MSNKEAIANVVDESQPKSVESLSTEGLNPHTNPIDPNRKLMQTERFTETETVEKAATNVHPDIQNPEAIKERVSEVFIGATKKCSEDLYTALVDELGHAVAKLKTTKAPSERGEVIHQISELNQKISTVLDLFLSSN